MPASPLQRPCPLCGTSRGRILFFATDVNARTTPRRFSVARCPCGMAFLDFVPARPTDFYPSSYAPHAEAPEPRRRSTRFALIEHLRPRRLLDVGCGRGADLLTLKERGWSVRGVETNPLAVERARGAGLDVRQGTLFEAGLESGSADLLTFFHVLEHVPAPLATLLEARRILAPGGLLLVQVPNFRSLNARIFRQHWYELDVPRHLNFFDASTLRRSFARAGFATRLIRTRAPARDFQRSLALAWGRNPLRPFGGIFRAASKTINLFRWGDVLETLAVNRAEDRAGADTRNPA
ncbi:MAG: class I SAM-dependent methyltransferase [Planctomycetes bacterium]|nr:class I SAM-dependent methyltransferase [Planctomycetota bacterium]